MNKTPLQSKVVVWGGLIALLTAIGQLAGAIDLSKLPPEVQKWAVPVVSAFMVLMRLWNSNITVETGEPGK